MTSEESGATMGVAWYRRDQWERLHEVAADPDTLERTYDEWLALAQKAMIDLLGQGTRAHRVEVDVEELVQWCRDNERKLDGDARAAYAVARLQETVRSKEERQPGSK